MTEQKQPRIILSQEVDYEKLIFSHSKYKFQRVLSDSANNTVTVAATSTQESIIDIPSVTFNLAQSYLRFRTVTAGVAALDQFVPNNTIPHIKSLTLTTANGLQLSHIDHFNKYMSAIPLVMLPMKDYLSADRMAGLSVSPDSSDRFDDTALDRPRTEHLYWQSAGVLDTDITLAWSFPLSTVFHSIFAYDKDLWFGENLTLRIVWAEGQHASWLSAPVNDPDAAAVAQTADTTISNIELMLAVQQDPALKQGLMNTVKAGKFNITIPYIVQHKQRTGVGNISITRKYTRAHGNALQRVYYVPFHDIETADTLYDRDNLNASATTNLQTTLENEVQQDFRLNSANNVNHDYMVNRKFLKNSAMMTQDIYSYNFLHIDDWSHLEKDDPLTHNKITGVSLDTDKTYTIDTTGVLARQNYVFAIMQRLLSIQPGFTIFR